MARSFQTSLGEVAERLRRSLGLTSTVGAVFDGAAFPLTAVTIADDGQRPGTAASRNRRFFRGVSQAGAAQQPSIFYRLKTDCIIDMIFLSVQTNSTSGNLSLVAPGAADPYATASTAPFTDRPRSLGDIQPILHGQINTAAMPGTLLAGLNLTSGAPLFLPVSMMLEQEWGIAYTTGAAFTGTLLFGIIGRTF